MIEPMDIREGQSRARVICDDCGKDEVVACVYTGLGDRRTGERKPNESQARARALAMGWKYVKGKLRCGPCEAKRKAHKEPAKVEKKASVEPIRKPDGKQKRLIILALEDAYDDAAKRYKGTDTDKTVAESLGAGVMPGWVAQIREEMFGPAGNEELDRLREDIAAQERETRKLIETFGAEQAKKIAALSARVEALVKSHDKRVG